MCLCKIIIAFGALLAAAALCAQFAIVGYAVWTNWRRARR